MTPKTTYMNIPKTTYITHGSRGLGNRTKPLGTTVVLGNDGLQLVCYCYIFDISMLLKLKSPHLPPFADLLALYTTSPDIRSHHNYCSHWSHNGIFIIKPYWHRRPIRLGLG